MNNINRYGIALFCAFVNNRSKRGYIRAGAFVVIKYADQFSWFIGAKKFTIIFEGDCMELDYSLIGKRVAARRKQLDFTQAELSEKTKLTPKYISNIETSHSIPSIESVMQLCAALDIQPNYLLFGIAEKKIPKLDEINHLLSACDTGQLDKIIEYIDFITNRK